MGENGLTSQEEAIALAFPGSFRQKELNKLKSVQNKDMQNGRPHKVFPYFPSFGSQFIHASDSDVFFFLPDGLKIHSPPCWLWVEPPDLRGRHKQMQLEAWNASLVNG